MSQIQHGTKLTKFKAIQNYINETYKEAVDLWQTLVRINTASSQESLPNEDNIKSCLAAMVQFLKHGFRHDEISTVVIGEGTRYYTAPDTENDESKFSLTYEPGCAVITLDPLKRWPRKPIKRNPIVFVGHLDTVYSPKYWENHQNALTEPGELINGRIYGPGALDMKGGLAVALLILRTIIHFRLNNRTVKFIITMQEEHGHCSLSNPTMEDLFRKHTPPNTEAAFVFETCSIRNEVIVGRRGVAHCELTFTGPGGHPGRDKIVGPTPIESATILTRWIRGRVKEDKERCQVTVTHIEGGFADNAIPECCRMVLDLRYSTQEDLEQFTRWLKENFDRYDRNQKLSPCKWKYTDEIPASPDLSQSRALKEALCEAAEYYTTLFPGPSVVSSGGGDASYFTTRGIPTLDSLGVMGANNHTVGEYAILESLKQKAAMLMALLFDKFFYATGVDY